MDAWMRGACNRLVSESHERAKARFHRQRATGRCPRDGVQGFLTFMLLLIRPFTSPTSVATGRFEIIAPGRATTFASRAVGGSGARDAHLEVFIPSTTFAACFQPSEPGLPRHNRPQKQSSFIQMISLNTPYPSF